MNYNTGDTAWILVAAAMVLLMTPGLAFFYGGMVRGKRATAKRRSLARSSAWWMVSRIC